MVILSRQVFPRSARRRTVRSSLELNWGVVVRRNLHRRLLVCLAMVVAAAVPAGMASATEPAEELAKPFVSQKTPPNAPSVHECDASGNPAANVRLDCDDPFPNDEPNIVVDPADPNHMIASSNDYGSCCDEYYTSFDAGQTWSTGNMSTRART